MTTANQDPGFTMPLQEISSFDVDIIWKDDFQDLPVNSIDDYHTDVPHGYMAIDGMGGLILSGSWAQPLNQNGKCKSELGPRLGDPVDRMARIPYGQERWTALTFTMTADWQRDGNKCDIFEFHGTEDPGEEGIGRYGSLNIHIGGDDIYGWRAWNDQRIQSSNDNKIECFRFQYLRGAKYRFIYRTIFDWSPTGIGSTDIWIVTNDGVPVSLFSELGPNAYNDAYGPYFKFGIYLPQFSHPARPTTPPKVLGHTLKFERLLICGPGTKLEDML